MRRKSDTPSLKPQRSKDSSSLSSVSDVGHNKVTEPGEARGLPFLSKAAVRNHQVNKHPSHPAIMVFSCIPHGFSLNLKAFGFLVLSSVLSCHVLMRVVTPPKAPNGALITIEAAPRASGAGNELVASNSSGQRQFSES